MFSKLIIHTHAFIPDDEIDEDRLERLRDALTVVSRYDKSEFPTYALTQKAFGIPLYYREDWDSLARTVEDIRLDGSKVNYTFTSEMRPGQVPLIERFREELLHAKTGFVIDAPPGFGKTVVILQMIAMLQRSAIVVVPRSNLVNQWVSRIVEHTTLKRSQVGIVNGRHVDWEGKPITVGLVHSLAAQLNDNRRFQENFGTAVFDEVDRSVPPATFSPVLCMFPAKYRIGASATVTRKDGLHKILDYHIGQVRIKGSDTGRMKPKVLVIRSNLKHRRIPSTIPKMNRRGIIISTLSKSHERNETICRYIDLIVKSGRRCLVLSDRTEQLVRLKMALIRVHHFKPGEVGYYADSIPDNGKKRKVGAAELKRSAHVCSVVLATYGKAGIGTDIPDLAGLVYATPQSDVRQTQGRIERLLEGKAEPVVVDIIDEFYKDAQGWGRSRLSYYERNRLKMKMIPI